MTRSVSDGVREEAPRTKTHSGDDLGPPKPELILNAWNPGLDW